MDNLPAVHTPPDSKDLMVYSDPLTGKMRYLDLRTGKPLANYTSIEKGVFSNELADILCASIREGKSLKLTCQENQLSQALFYAWLSIFPEFKKRYTEARKQRADYHFHRVIELADGAVGMDKEFVQGLKVAVDAHKWAAEKSDPERFAKPKDESNTIGSITINLQTGVLDREAPKDIVVDQYGNFQGFGDAYEMERDDRERSNESPTGSEDRERFRIFDELRPATDGDATPDSGSGEGSTGREEI